MKHDSIHLLHNPAANDAEAPLERRFQQVITPFQEFVHREATGGVVLMACAVIALVMANSPLAHAYHGFFETTIALDLGIWRIEHSLHHWINDGLMAIFFFLVGLEIKREILVGELSRVQQAILPIGAAIGGMVGPAALYYLIAGSGPGARGWGIPMATDIAFAVGVVALLGTRVPKNLVMFLVALAIVDDLGAVLVIAIFYTSELSWSPLLVGLCLFMVAIGFNQAGIRSPYPYLITGIGVWMALLFSGLHATLAGVVMAVTIPCRPRYDPNRFDLHMRELLDHYRVTYKRDGNILTNDRLVGIVERLENSVTDARTALQRLEHRLHMPVAMGVIPIFALANAGVHLDLSHPGELLSDRVLLGVVAGLLLGKCFGITGACFLLLKMGWAKLPDGVTVRHLFGASLLAGIGFTMSMFIAELAFAGAEQQLTAAKAGILLASVIAGAAGYLYLRLVSDQGAPAAAAVA